MLRLVARLLGYAALAAAMAAGVLDGARGIADGTFQVTSLGGAIQWLSPSALPALGSAIGRIIHPLLWDPILITLLRVPAVPALFALGLGLLLAGRPKTEAIAPPA